MKVAVVTQYFPTSSEPTAGHSAYQTIRILAGLCDLHVFCPVATYPRLLKPPTRIAAAADLTWSPADVAATYIPYPVLPVVSRPFNGLVMGTKLLPYVRRFQPDVVLNYVVYPDGFAAVRIGHALGVPVVLTAIGSDLNRMSDRVVAWLTRWALRQADCVTTVSADLGKTAVRLGANPATTKAIINGYDASVFYPRDRMAARVELGVEAGGEVAVYVGRLDVRKGLIELIDAVATLRARRPALHCYLVGDGPDRGLLLEAIARNHAEEFVTLIPPCPTGRVALWMAASDLVTLPSYREGCPNVIIEGLGAGRPIVATNVGGIPELVDESCGRLIPAMDVPALVSALDDVLSRNWSAAAIAAKHSRTWVEVAGELHGILERVSQEGRRSDAH